MTGIGKLVNLGLRLADDQLIDADGHRCGRVDDVQFTGGPGKRPVVSGLLVGPGAWPIKLRRPLGAAMREFVPDHIHHVEWKYVSKIQTSVELSATAEELGLETHDGKNIQWIGAPPPGTLRLSELLRSHLHSPTGEKLGRVWEIRAERDTAVADEHVNEEWRVTGLLTGRSGFAARIGAADEEDQLPAGSFTPWERVAEITLGRVTLSS